MNLVIYRLIGRAQSKRAKNTKKSSELICSESFTIDLVLQFSINDGEEEPQKNRSSD